MNSVLRATWATYLFELRMSLTGRRALTGLVLACFPPFLCFLISMEQDEDIPMGMILCTLLFAIELFALLLWIPTGIYSELEGKNWVFSTSRPSGRTAMILGKWLSGATWAAIVAIFSLGTSFLILSVSTDLSGVLFPLALTVILAALAYGALFSLVSVLALKRAMGLCVAYMLLVEVMIGFVPAMIQKGTAFYHLRCVMYKLGPSNQLGIDQMEFELFTQMFGLNQLPLWGNLLCILAISLVFLSLAVFVINTRQLITKQEV